MGEMLEYPKSTCCLCSLWDDEYGCTYPPCLEEEPAVYQVYTDVLLEEGYIPRSGVSSEGLIDGYNI